MREKQGNGVELLLGFSIERTMINMLYNVFFGLMGLAALLSLIYFPLWAILHKLLPPKLDPVLFKEPWFQKSELVNYQFFPLSLIRSLNYSYLIAWPSMAKRRRFRGVDQDLPVSAIMTTLCKIHISVGVIGTLIAIPYFSIPG